MMSDPLAQIGRYEDNPVRLDIEEAGRLIGVHFALNAVLNLLLAHANADGLVLSRFALTHEGDRWHGRARGEPWHPGLERGTQVKGATLTALRVARVGDGWEARCVVDL